ncbi:hypothetical protein HL653_08375 [Sphingomonas sp. AP4-R1]|nr:hypothetical protein [Sphingomonas sp. AP4-R1]QJU57803.1 hypothetical protein HL653_08375 [Sphingomonas sp. AP4-R1]
MRPRPSGPRTAPIYSNDLATFLADLTDDVVLQAPGASEMVGKAAP